MIVITQTSRQLAHLINLITHITCHQYVLLIIQKGTHSCRVILSNRYAFQLENVLSVLLHLDIDEVWIAHAHSDELL